MTSENTTQNQSKAPLIVVGVLLLLSAVGNIIQYGSCSSAIENQEVRYDSLSTKHIEINDLYSQSVNQVNTLKAQNLDLDADLQDKISQIEKIKLENDELVKSNISKDELNRKLRANLALIKKLNGELEGKVQELIAQNKVLTEDNKELKIVLDSVNTQNTELLAKIEIASALKSTDFTVFPLKKRSNGKYKETSKAKLVNKIKVEFKINANQIAEQGEEVKVSMMIKGPSGSTLGTLNERGETASKEPNGFETFVDFKTFTYSGADQMMVLAYEQEDRNFTEGQYIVQVLIDGKVSGATTFELR